jgi:hypothetical protein
MTATNHAITAANLALITKQWWVLPIALVSHFALDMLPHYGEPTLEARGTRFKTVLAVDIVMLMLLTWLVTMTAGQYLWLVLASMFVAMLPDSVWIYRYWREHKEGELPMKNPITYFHAKIQWGERYWGWIIEIGWFVAMLFMYAGLVVKV